MSSGVPRPVSKAVSGRIPALTSRRAETEERILAAASDLLREQGPEAVNVAAVAARSGIARTTIYRRYRDRLELLQAALRLRPDRILLGELRGTEAVSFLRAVNTGHPGSFSTIHAPR